MDNQIFPSFVLSLASIHSEEDAEGFTDAFVRGRTGPRDTFRTDAQRFDYMTESGRIGVIIRNPGVNTRIKYSIQIDKIAEPQSFEITTRSDEKALALICPALAWNFDALRTIERPFTANAKFTVSIGDRPAETKNIVVRVRTLNDAVYAYEYKKYDKTAAFRLNAHIFVAYVNEDHPMMDKLLKEALETKIVNSFAGYQAGNKNEVMRQVYAIWYILQKRGIKYSSITQSSAYGRREYSQHVRLFEEALENSQANCVDGSVVFVSILRKIGINANLVLIPGHCFVVFYNGTDATVGLETTMIGNVDLKKAAADPELIKKYGADTEKMVSLASFLDAVDVGSATYSKNLASIRAEKDPRYLFVDIAVARKRHWLPISR